MCPDCNDGLYYPLIGSPEPCQTCHPKQETKAAFALKGVMKQLSFDDLVAKNQAAFFLNVANRQAEDRIHRLPAYDIEGWASAAQDRVEKNARYAKAYNQAEDRIHRRGIESTDWSQWFPDSLTAAFLGTMFEKQPVQLLGILNVDLPVIEAIIGRFFRIIPKPQTVRFFSRRHTVHLSTMAKFLNEWDKTQLRLRSDSKIKGQINVP